MLVSTPSFDSKSEERAYWKAMRDSYVDKNDRLFAEPGYSYCDPEAFYRWVFPEGFLEARGRQVDWDEPGGGHPNAIALVVTNEMRKETTRDGREVERPVVRRHMLLDDMDDVMGLVSESLDLNEPVIVAPVSYFGRKRDALHARYLHAFAFDLDGVGVEELGNLLKQIRNGHADDERLRRYASLPQPSAIVNSGRGLHLYYVLDHPVPLYPRYVPFLQELKYRLTDVIWTEYTSNIPLDQIQYQGIYQGFRMVGTTTRLNGRGLESKTRDKYETVAFRYESGGQPWTVSLDYLVGYAGFQSDGDKIVAALGELWETGGRTPLARAAKQWPVWYQRRVVEGLPAGRWTNKRALYDWWLRTITDETSKAVGHRYWRINSLAAFAQKCRIPFEELEKDAYGLVSVLNGLRDQHGHRTPFTDADVAAALDYYFDPEAHKASRESIGRHSAIDIPANKRNGRKLDQHIAMVNGLRKMRRDVLGEDEYGKSGRPKGSGNKADLVRAYAEDYPEANHSQIARALGVSRPTVIKWLRPGWREEFNGGDSTENPIDRDGIFNTSDDHMPGRLYPNGHGGFSVELHRVLDSFADSDDES